jgi:chromosome segregation ATPase
MMKSPIVVALIHPLNVLMAGLAVFAGLVSAWWLFPIGAIFWLVMVVAVARTPSLRMSHQMGKRAPLAQRFQKYFDRIERVQVSIFNTLSSAPNRTRRVFQPVQAEVGALTDQVHRLCQRMTTLENFRVVSQSRADLEADLRYIEETLETTTDPLVRREYEESRQSLENKLDKLDTVSTQLERVEAQLLSLTSEMDSLMAEIVRLQAAGPEEASNHVPRLVKRLRTQSEELEQFQREAVSV